MTATARLPGHAIAVMLAAAVFGLALGHVRAAERAVEAGPPYERDNGPSSVDVSAFPAEIQAAYEVFAIRCALCHVLARPINTDLPAQGWKTYIKKMMNKPGSGISPTQGKTIYKFLKYYQAHKDRKRGK